MPSFVYKGRTRAGQLQEGVLVADSQAQAVADLRRRQIQVTTIREKGREIKLIPRLPRGISRKRVAIFTRQFSVMLDAGLPLVQCLEILGEQEENRTFQGVIQAVRSDVESGSSLADAMRNTRRRSTRCTSTWWRPARRAASWTSSCSGCRPTSRRRSS